MAQYEHVCHTFRPVYDRESKILILGSLPSMKSREAGFYYGHPQNRFWKVLAAVLSCPVPVTTKDKVRMLLIHHIAVWDVIASCDIVGSSDSSIKNVVPADIGMVLRETAVRRIYANGRKAESLYRNYIFPETKMPAIALPSTSPANAAFSLERLTELWGQELRASLEL